MSARGVFHRLADDPSGRRVFAVSGSNLIVDESSVSSEWTEDSDENTAPPSNFDQSQVAKDSSIATKARRKRVKKWRVKHSLAKHRHLCDRSDSSRSTNSTSSTHRSETSSSASESEQAEDVPKAQRREVRNERRIKSIPHMLDIKREDIPGTIQWNIGSKPYRNLALIANFLSPQEIECIHVAAKHSSVKEINDRKGYLAFKHKVVRFEMQLRALYPALYTRLLALMRSADAEGWQKLRKKKNKVYPEIEYIEYDVELLDGECYIEPHVDNKAGVTMVAMLSPSCDYAGGNNCFRRGSGNEGHRQGRLEQGDVVMFRGEKLLHWITDVKSGRRVILQIELSRV